MVFGIFLFVWWFICLFGIVCWWGFFCLFLHDARPDTRNKFPFLYLGFNSIPAKFTLISCLLIFFQKIEFYSLFVYGFGCFLLSIHLLIPTLHNFSVSIICVIDWAFPVDCDNRYEKGWMKLKRNDDKINVILQNLRYFLQEVGSPWSIILKDFRSSVFLTQVCFKTLYTEKNLGCCCGCLPPSGSCNGLLPLWFIMVSHLLLASVQDAVHF